MATSQHTLLLLTAWISTVVASPLPEILVQEIFAGDVSAFPEVRMAVLLALFSLALVWQSIGPLRSYLGILLVLTLMLEGFSPLLVQSTSWQRWFTGDDTPWFWTNFGGQLLRLLPALALWVLLVLMGLKRRDYYLVVGQPHAPVEPIRWLGMKESEPWARFGRSLALIISAVTLGLLLLGARPDLKSLAQILPLLPAIILFAAMNAFWENFTYRAALLSQLVPLLGKHQALLLASVLFGLMHYYSFPPGVLGVLLAGLLGWLLGKSMVETHGFLVPWAIQLPLDVIAISGFFL
jgi:hypothetical protein